jgi:hypothetical protein
MPGGLSTDNVQNNPNRTDHVYPASAPGWRDVSTVSWGVSSRLYRGAVLLGNRPIRLAIDMGQDNAVGIDDPVSTGHRLHRPGLGKAARGHGRG